MASAWMPFSLSPRIPPGRYLPPGYEKQINQYYGMGPHLHDYLQEMNREVLGKYDIMTVAEGAGSTLEDAHALVDPERHELNMAYSFEGIDLGHGAPIIACSNSKKSTANGTAPSPKKDGFLFSSPITTSPGWSAIGVTTAPHSGPFLQKC
jgi:glycosidase